MGCCRSNCNKADGYCFQFDIAQQLRHSRTLCCLTLTIDPLDSRVGSNSPSQSARSTLCSLKNHLEFPLSKYLHSDLCSSLMLFMIQMREREKYGMVV